MNTDLQSSFEAEITKLKKQLKAKTDELNATKKSLKDEQIRRKQSSTALKKRIKELTDINEDLTKQLEAVRNLQTAYDNKPSNSPNPSSSTTPYSFVVDDLLKNELHGLRIQHKQDVAKMATFKKELKEAHEKITDLENVLEAHQLEIEEHKNDIESLNSSLASEQCKQQNKESKDSKGNDKRKDVQYGSTGASIFLQKLVGLKKDSNNILAELNSPSYKEMRANFDEQLSKMKAENNDLVNSVTKVKLTTRSFEVLEKDLMNLRIENNQKIKQVRKDATETATKLNALYKEFTKEYPKKCTVLIDQYNNELKLFNNVNYWGREKTLQDEIIKKLTNEKEFLLTIIAKQDDI